MNKTIGILGYLLLVISGVFLDAPIIALLAMPLFLTGLILLVIFYLGLIDKKKPDRWLFVLQVAFGTVLLCGVFGFAAVEYNQYLVSVDRDSATEPSYSTLIIVIGINLVASLLIYLGIKNSSKINEAKLLFVWLPSFILIPLTIILLKLTVLTGIWFGG